MRHIWKSETILTPNDPLILDLRTQFFTAVPPAMFANMSFANRMNAVDVFIKDVVPWKEDFALYGVVGLLVTPHEVLTNGAGDCQGQAVTTASLLMSMGYHAAVVETPFHWWTHAWDAVTGEEIR